MTSVLRFVDDRVRVERGVFGLMDLDTVRCPNPWPADLLPEAEVVWAQTNRVDFRSVAPDHYAAVRLEAWDGEPSDPDEPWDDDHEVELLLTSGVVELWSLTGGPSAQSLEAGAGGQVYRLRVYCRGRQELLERYFESPSTIFEGIERYVLRFWPHPATAHPRDADRRRQPDHVDPSAGHARG